MNTILYLKIPELFLMRCWSSVWHIYYILLTSISTKSSNSRSHKTTPPTTTKNMPPNGDKCLLLFVLRPLSVKWLCCMHTDMRKGRKAGGNARQTLACMWVAHLIIKLIKTSIWQCHSCPAKKEEEGRKSNLNAAVYKDPMSMAAFHQALHVFGLHSHRESGGMWGACKRGKKQLL